MNIKQMKQSGFSLIEMMVVTIVFTIITGVVFMLLIVSEQRYRTETEVLDSFQGANVAIDQMTRDIHQAGYPPANAYAAAAAAFVAANPQLVAIPFAWYATAGYPNAPCTLTAGGSCGGNPGDYDIMLEEDPDPVAVGVVQWIRYQLPAGSHTLMRAAVTKDVTKHPGAKTGPFLVPYLDGVMNNASAAEIANIKQYYPDLFPANAPVPIFTYYCDSAAGPVPCTAANTPRDIREVQITLIVQALAHDEKTQAPRIVSLTGQAVRINPNQ